MPEASLSSPLPEGSIIGILGGGQLGRMTAIAAAELGYRCHVYAPEGDAPACDVAAFSTRADYDDGLIIGVQPYIEIITTTRSDCQ